MLVLDEADRMIADGHFKELRDILAHIYTRRVQIRQSKIKNIKGNKAVSDKAEIVTLGHMEDSAKDNTNFYVGKNLESENAKGIDMSQVQDLFDNDEIFEEIKAEGNVVLDQATDYEGRDKKKQRQKSQKEIDRLHEASFVKEYQKAGGIQHIICSATLTIDK